MIFLKNVLNKFFNEVYLTSPFSASDLFLDHHRVHVLHSQENYFSQVLAHETIH